MMLGRIKNILENISTKIKSSSNVAILGRQKLLLKIIIFIVLLIFVFLIGFIQEKDRASKKKKEAEAVEDDKVVIELASSKLDIEKRWRDNVEDDTQAQKKYFNEELEKIREEQKAFTEKTNNVLSSEIAELKDKLERSQRELINASLELKKVASSSEHELPMKEKAIDVKEFGSSVELDIPKSAENYIPEGTYFTGHLLGGIVVSTALGSPDRSSTPVMIRLTARGNLSKLNPLQIDKCRIQGSSYGDLSSERAVIRLEKLICEKDGLYQTSKIAGQVYGPDGLNGLKGTVVSTSDKHIKNAIVGGMISGLSGNVKGQDPLGITSSGLINTNKKTPKDMLTGGVAQGLSNAGEKVAEYYLKQAEAMSPVLTIPAGVRVNAQITKGFFVGEIGTHKKIKQEKQ